MHASPAEGTNRKLIVKNNSAPAPINRNIFERIEVARPLSWRPIIVAFAVYTGWINLGAVDVVLLNSGKRNVGDRNLSSGALYYGCSLYYYYCNSKDESTSGQTCWYHINSGHWSWFDAAVAYLVQQRLLLTALELHQELLERGEENKNLKELFTTGKLLDELNDNTAHPLNQQLVRRPVARNTNSYQEMDSRVALLEYELRQERQTTQALRQELSLLWNRKKKEDQAVASEGEAAYSQLEKRALSYLIKKFLLDQGLKLTAISLTEEVSCWERRKY